MRAQENKCGPCNQNCGQSRQCPARLAWEASVIAGRLAAKQAAAKEPKDSYMPNAFVLACMGSLMVWVFIIAAVYVIFN